MSLRKGDGITARELGLEILAQPTKTTCGPTCLHAVYKYFGSDISLDQVIAEVVPLSTGGTLAVWLGNHALKRGYRASLYTTNLQLFDPTWFDTDVDLAKSLKAQSAFKQDPTLQEATAAHLEFLALGGRLRFGPVTLDQVYEHLKRGVPLLTGVSATFLYREEREYMERPDPIRGTPVGHFVVLCGAEPNKGRVLVADPLEDEPRNRSHLYWVEADRLLAAILLGVLTYDAAVLVIEPPDT